MISVISVAKKLFFSVSVTLWLISRFFHRELLFTFCLLTPVPLRSPAPSAVNFRNSVPSVANSGRIPRVVETAASGLAG